MRISELLFEKPVSSTWISDLKHARAKKILTMTLSNGNQYEIPGIGRTTFERWTKTPSKGQFFHSNIKGRFNINRIN